MSVIEGSLWETVFGVTERQLYHGTTRSASITSYQDCLECALALVATRPEWFTWSLRILCLASSTGPDWIVVGAQTSVRGQTEHRCGDRPEHRCGDRPR